MASIVKLTSSTATEHPVFVNLDQVRWFERPPASTYTTILFSGEDRSNAVAVVERPDEILAMVGGHG